MPNKETLLSQTKIKIGVSHCLLGENVRYNGETKRNSFIIETVAQIFDLVPICPEVECGMPVPREPMRLHGTQDSPILLTHNTKIDHTPTLNEWCDKKIEELKSQNIKGFILKARSPSCGLKNIEVFDDHLNVVATTSGLFILALKKAFPNIPIVDEEMIEDPKMFEEFKKQVTHA